MKYSIIYSAYNQRPIFERFIFPALERQTEKDFEVIIGDDGSNDRLCEWARQPHVSSFPVKTVWQEDSGYNYTQIMNKAASLADGDYLIFLSGDTYPHDDFLEEMGRALKPDRIVNGMRENVDFKTGKVMSKDWRIIHTTPFIAHLMSRGVEIFPVSSYQFPWSLMTFNTLGIPRAVWQKIGGISSGYNGIYGKMDWSVCMKAFFSDFGLWYNTAALACHEDGGVPKTDDPKGEEVFREELKEWKLKRYGASPEPEKNKPIAEIL